MTTETNNLQASLASLTELETKALVSAYESSDGNGHDFGYSDDITALQDKAQDAYTNNKNPNAFRAGTLLIDIVDGKTFKLLKRGYTTRTLLSNPSPSARAARIQGAVDEILRNARFAQ